MTLARRLREAGNEVTLIEAAPSLGGLASAWDVGDVVWDRHYHVTLLSDRFTLGLVADLGLASEMEFRPTRTGFFSGGRLASMSTSLEFLRFPVLSLWEKARLAATILRASRVRDFRSLEKIPVEKWLRRWSGNGTFERVWLPLLRSKLGEAWRDASAAFIWATIARLYAARRSGLKREMFGHVRGGYARVLDAFTKKLRADGVRVCTGRPVAAVRLADDGRLRVETKGGACDEFDQVVVTLPAAVAARLCPDLTDDEQARLTGVRYVGIVCASLLLKRPLSPFYVTNITDDGLPFTGVIEMTTLVDPRHFGGRSLVYLPKYVRPDDPLFSRSDDEVRVEFLAGLRRMHPGLDPADVEAFRVSRVRHVFALSTLGYSERLPPLTTSVPGLHVVSSAHVLNGTLNVNETLRLAEWAAKGLASPERRATLPPAREASA
jgi:protoporphyrinogen oxidase